MDAEVYANMATTQYTRLTYVVPYVQHEPGETAAAQANANVIHKEERGLYNIYGNIDAALKQEVIA